MNRKISPEKYFTACNGLVIKNIKELAMVMDELSEQDFNHHVNAEKNDFSAWIRNVFEQDSLSQSLESMQDRRDMQIALFKHIIK